MSPARLLAVLLFSTLLACTGDNPPESQGPALPTISLGESTVGAPFARSLASTQGATPLSYAAQGLPPGITLDAQTGALSGSATAAGSFTVDASVTDAAGRSDQRSYPLVVLEAPHFVTASLPSATLASTYVTRVEASGGKAPLVYAFHSGSFPPGLSIDASGTLSGTPSLMGSFSFELSATDAYGSVARAPFSLVVSYSLPMVITTELPVAHVSRDYRFTLAATGGTPPYSWSKVEGALPEGLDLSSTGELSGAPSTAGTFSFIAEARDSRGQPAQRALSLTVVPALAVTGSLPDGYRGVAYSAGIEASGGVPPYSYTVVTGSLPAGIQVDNLGRFSGTPAASGTFGLTLTLQDSSQQSLTRAFPLTVYELPGFATTTLRDGAVGAAYSETLQPTGGKAPFTYRLIVGSLPAGLRLQGNVITGTPTALGTASFTLEVRDVNNQVGTQAFTLRVISTLAISTTTLPTGDTGRPYSTQLAATGGNAPLSWSATGTLPPGLSLSSSGLLSGTPTAAGSFTFTARVTDALSLTDSRALTVVIQGPPVITTSALDDAYVGVPYTFTLAVSGGRAPFSWSITDSPPPGLTLSSSGVLSGNVSYSDTFSFTVRVTDSLGRTQTRVLSLTAYLQPSVDTFSLNDGYVSESYSQLVTAWNGKPPYTFSVSSGSLPAGITLASSGALTGTPTSAGTATLDIQVRDANGQTATRTLSLSVYTLPTFVTTSLPEATHGVYYSQSLVLSGGRPVFYCYVESGSLPDGIGLDSGGSIWGAASSTSDATFTIRCIDSNNRSAAQTYTITIYDPPVILTSVLPVATVGTPYSFVPAFTGNRPPFLWAHEGTLPPGLSVGTDGSISGTPTAAGSWGFSVTLQDSRGSTDSRFYFLDVNDSAPDGGAPDGGFPDGGFPDGGFPDGGFPDGGPLPDGGTPPPFESLFMMGQWNIEWFGSDTQGPPRSTSPGGTTDDLQIANAANVLGGTGMDLWALVEIADTPAFNALKAQLPGYDGFLSNDPRVAFGSSYYSPSSQKLGVLYNNKLVYQSATLILREAATDFGGRPPMRVDFLISIHGASTPLTVIVLHMKAFEDQASYDKRQRASTALKNYLDANLPTQRVFVVGDWNDDVDVSITDSTTGTPLPSPYEGFVADSSHYSFVTRPLSLAGEASTVDFPDMIDHTLASDEVMADYVSNSAQVIRPIWISDYAGTTSDHYPVFSQYDFAGPSSGSVTLTAPAGGSYSGGSTILITWTPPPGFGPAWLEYTLDDGSTWSTVAWIPDSGVTSYMWTVPNVNTDVAYLRIREDQAPWRADITDVPMSFVSAASDRVFINEYLANEPSGTLPDGGVGALVDYEFVELVNSGSQPKDISGWTIWDGATSVGARHVFSAGTVLQPGKAWVVYGGPTAFPPGTPNTEAASSGRLGLNNTGTDFVTLRDASGTLVDEATYSSTVDNVSYNRSVDANPDVGFVLHSNISSLPSSAGRRVDGSPF